MTDTGRPAQTSQCHSVSPSRSHSRESQTGPLFTFEQLYKEPLIKVERLSFAQYGFGPRCRLAVETRNDLSSRNSPGVCDFLDYPRRHGDKSRKRLPPEFR